MGAASEDAVPISKHYSIESNTCSIIPTRSAQRSHDGRRWFDVRPRLRIVCRGSDYHPCGLQNDVMGAPLGTSDVASLERRDVTDVIKSRLRW